MSRIAVIIDDMFEDSEYEKPVDAFRKAGHETVSVGLKAGSTVKGKRGRSAVRIDESVGNVSADGFDALLIPGGYSPDRLRAHPDPVDFVRRFVESGKPVLTICHGPQLLITAGVLEGRTITGYKSIVQDIKNAGAAYVNAEVVRDRNIVSSREPGDIPAFVEASLELISESG